MNTNKSIFGLFVARDGRINYPGLIVDGLKTIETRPGTRNVLKKLIGQRVAIIDSSSRPALVIGYVTIYGSLFCPSEYFDEFRRETFVPAGTKYDDNGRGKFMYYLCNAEKCRPYPVPENRINHGRSYCEFMTA